MIPRARMRLLAVAARLAWRAGEFAKCARYCREHDDLALKFIWRRA